MHGQAQMGKVFRNIITVTVFKIWMLYIGGSNVTQQNSQNNNHAKTTQYTVSYNSEHAAAMKLVIYYFLRKICTPYVY
jgi:hypothetical protein